MIKLGNIFMARCKEIEIEEANERNRVHARVKEWMSEQESERKRDRDVELFGEKMSNVWFHFQCCVGQLI